MKKFYRLAISMALAAAMLAALCIGAFADDASAASDDVAEAEAQGIIITDNFELYTDEDDTFTFYSEEYDNSIYMKNKPVHGSCFYLGRVTLPFNGRIVGTSGNWYLIDNLEGKYFYIYAPIVKSVAIDKDTAADDYSALIPVMEESGAVIPEGFEISKAVNGRMVNSSGSSGYALYKYHAADDNEHYGLFYFINTNNEKTANYKSWVTIYGYADNGLALVYHEGEYFWCGTGYFKAA